VPRLPRRRCVTRQAAFLAAYRETTTSIPKAARAAGIEVAQHDQWLGADAKYWQAFVDLQAEIAQVLQDRAVERAMDGWVTPVLYRKRVCGEIQHWSDRLLFLLLKAFKPRNGQ